MSDSRIASLLREPLLHFLAIGVVLYLVFDWVNDDVDPHKIVFTQAELDSYEARWIAARSRPPSEEEMRGLIDQAIRDKILAREARELGLDQNDAIVQRRLAQKMEFLFSDLMQVPEPTDAELQVFLGENLEKFSEPKRLSFTHIYFNPEKRTAVRDDAQQLLSLLTKDSNTIEVENAGDRLLLPVHYESATRTDIRKSFGEAFAQELFASARPGWQGPLESGYGIHLVFIESIVAAKTPELEDIKDILADEWTRRKQLNSNEALYQTLREKYEIELGAGG